MILQALNAYYDRFATTQDILPPYGWSWEKISYCIVLNADGSIHHIEDLRIEDTDKKGKTKLLQRSMMMPMLPEGKTSGIKSNPLWDNSAYTLGLSDKPKDLDKKYKEFWSIFSSLDYQVSKLCEFINTLTAKQKSTLCIDINKIFQNQISPAITPENIGNGLLANAIASQYPVASYQLTKFLTDLEVKMKNKLLAKYRSPTFYNFKCETKPMSAMANFRSYWDKNKKHDLISKDALDENFVFRLIDESNKFIHECQEFTEQWLSFLDNYRNELSRGQCLISGDTEQIADLHIRIKGVDGAQSSGAYIVSFNKDSFESYGLKRGKNASVGTIAAFKYVTALNYLLRKDNNNQRLKIGDAVTVFWATANENTAAEAAEDFFSALVNPTDAQQTAALASLLQQVAQGIPLQTLRPDLDPLTQFYVLGLSPNSARIAIRFWYVSTLAEMAESLAWHYQDLHLEPKHGNGLPEIWRLTYATAPVYIKEGKQKIDADKIPPLIAGQLARAIFTGQSYPQSLLAQVLMRMRLDGVVDYTRVSLCKAVINRKIRLNQSTVKEITVSLDLEEKNVAYRMGRLFAVLEGIQKEALGKDINATIRDRYWGAASATPALVFPMLERNMMNHLAKIRKEPEKQKLSGFFDWQIGSIKNGMPTFYPKSLNLQEQGRFAIGYYHQRFTRHIKTEKGIVENPVAVGEETINQDTQENA